MQKPLILYIDSQDYINIFNESKNGENRKILNKLISFRDDGNILIGFSFANIFEFITKPDEKNKLEWVRRGQLIKDVCGRNAFPNFLNLSKGERFPNDGQWLLSKHENLNFARLMKKSMKDLFLEKVSEQKNLNRKERRIWKKKTIKEIFILAQNKSYFEIFDFSEIPLPNKILEERLFERLLKGEISDFEFDKQILYWFSDPAEFSRLVYD